MLSECDASHGRHVEWILHARNATSTIRERWADGIWIIELLGTGRHDGSRFTTSTCSSPLCAQAQKLCSGWCGSAGVLTTSGTGLATPSTARTPIATPSEMGDKCWLF